MATIQSEPRPQRADAQRNRRRLIEAATELFSERGLDVGVGEIAARAEVGRATLFRNFPSKRHLIAAIVVERMQQSVQRARAALDADDPTAALFDLIESGVERSQADRALFDALSDTWLANDEIRGAHQAMLELLEQLIDRAQAAGGVRPDISAVDVVVLIKGVMEGSRSFQHLGVEARMRQLDLVFAAIGADGSSRPLRGHPPTVEDFERSMSCIAATSTR